MRHLAKPHCSLPSGSHLNMHKSGGEFVKYICACVNFCQLVGIFARLLVLVRSRLSVSQRHVFCCSSPNFQNGGLGVEMSTWTEVNLGMWRMKCSFSAEKCRYISEPDDRTHRAIMCTSPCSYYTQEPSGFVKSVAASHLGALVFSLM